MTRVLPKTEGAVEAAPPSHRGFSLSNRTRERIAGYLFVFPDALGLLIFVGGPMLLSLSLGFFSVSGFGEYSFVGLDNYRRMIGDPLFWRSLRVTILYIVLLVPALYVTGLGLALLVQRNTRFNGFVRTMLFVPQTVSLVVVSLVWQVLLVDKIGLLNQFTSWLHLGQYSWLGDPRFALYVVVFISVWFLMGFYMLIFLGGLQDIPKEYYEAARIDGASAHPVLPQNHDAVVASHQLFRTARLDRDGRLRLSDLRSHLCDDARRPGEYDVAGDLLHLSAGLSIQRVWLRRGDGVRVRRASDGADGADVHADARWALHL